MTQLLKASSLEADIERETKGDWIPHPDWAPLELKVSSLLLPAYRIDRDLLGQRLARQFKGKPIPPDIITTEVGKLYAKHILHDWRGWEITYSREKALEMLSNYKWYKLVAAIEWCAAKISDVDVEFIEDAAKNSERPSETA